MRSSSSASRCRPSFSGRSPADRPANPPLLRRGRRPDRVPPCPGKAAEADRLASPSESGPWESPPGPASPLHRQAGRPGEGDRKLTHQEPIRSSSEVTASVEFEKNSKPSRRRTAVDSDFNAFSTLRGSRDRDRNTAEHDPSPGGNARASSSENANQQWDSRRMTGVHVSGHARLDLHGAPCLPGTSRRGPGGRIGARVA